MPTSICSSAILLFTMRVQLWLGLDHLEDVCGLQLGVSGEFFRHGHGNLDDFDDFLVMMLRLMVVEREKTRQISSGLIDKSSLLLPPRATSDMPYQAALASRTVSCGNVRSDGHRGGVAEGENQMQHGKMSERPHNV